MPRQTRETQLPKAPAPALDWMKVASSGKVWEFVEGEDFTGKPVSYRARLKTLARKAAVDFNSVEVERSGRKILKVKAFLLPETNAPQATRKDDPGQTQLAFAAVETGGERDA